MSLIVSALLPVVVVMLLGYAAAWRQHFDGEHAAILNRMVMEYAFPLGLFAGIVSSRRDLLISAWALALTVFSGMILFFLMGLLGARYLFRRSTSASTITALTFGGSAAPILGLALLPPLMPRTDALVCVTAVSFAMTVVQNPIAIVLLNRARDPLDGHGHHHWGKLLAAPAKEPMVWAPVLAILLVVIGVRFPPMVLSSFTLLGSTTAGVALFASGIILYSQRVAFTWATFANVLLRNIVAPALTWLVLSIAGVSHGFLREAVIVMSVPAGTIVILLAIRFRLHEREAASTLLMSTVASVLTMAGFILLLG